MTSPALLVDLYELTMLDTYRRSGLADEPATFSLFVRDLPPTRNVLVAAGLDDALTWLETLCFDEAALDGVARLGLFEDTFLDWLAGLRFTGDVRAVAEGTPVFGGEPILEVDAPLGQAQLAETYLLNQIALQTSLASKAARIRQAAAGRPVFEFALRRVPGVDAGMKLARVAKLTGLAGTSNVAGALAYDLPAAGTMAHSLVQAHTGELGAFRVFAEAFGPSTVLLVDTFDTATGVRHAVEVARACREQGVELRGIRIDSGDLAMLAGEARAALDEAGFASMRVVVSGGLDEHDIAGLLAAGAPVDAFGVGTRLGVPDDAPVLEAVYKLVAVGGRPVRKTSPGKTTWPGAKQVWRCADAAGSWTGDVLALAGEPAPEPRASPLLEPVLRAGARTAAGRRDLAESREHFERSWAALPERLRSIDPVDRYPVRPSDALVALAESLDRDGR